MSWNSNKWAGKATKEDILKSNYDFVKENGWMHEDLNFGHEKYPLEDDGKFIAYTPQFNTLPSLEESKYVEIVFLKSYNYVTNENLIVGFYGFPDIGKFYRKADDSIYDDYDFGNLKSLPENIVRFENPILINDDICARKGYLPKGKKLGKMGYNYLKYENVLKILDQATIQSPCKKVSSIKYKFLVDPNLKS